MKITKILQDENLFDAAVLDKTESVILAAFSRAVGMQTALALGLGVPT